MLDTDTTSALLQKLKIFLPFHQTARSQSDRLEAANVTCLGSPPQPRALCPFSAAGDATFGVQDSVGDHPRTLSSFLTAHRCRLSSSTCDPRHQTLVSFIFL